MTVRSYELLKIYREDRFVKSHMGTDDFEINSEIDQLL